MDLRRRSAPIVIAKQSSAATVPDHPVGRKIIALLRDLATTAIA
jgi:hypothetical protein